MPGGQIVSTSRNRIEIYVRIPSSIAGDTFNYAVFAAGYSTAGKNVKIEEVSFTPDANMTGDNTNYCTLKFVNKGSDGSGTDVVGTKDFTLGVDLTAFDEYLTFGTLSNNTLSQGDVSAFEKTIAAGGLATPAGVVKIVFSREQA